MKYQAWLLALTLSICGFAHAQGPTPLKRLDAELLASDGQPNDGFGAHVAVDGDIVAVGKGLNPGSVYLYSLLSKGTVTEIAKLSASDGTPLFQGLAVGKNGHLVVAGAISDTVKHHPNQGAVYVFVEPKEGWSGNITETAKLTASDGAANNQLGISVSTTNGVIVAGAYLAGDKGQGEAYVYVEPQGGWVSGTETARLTASNGQPGDAFGVSVAVFGPRIVVGADGYETEEGIAYVFQEPVGGWKTMTETAQLTHPGTGEFFGYPVAVSGKTVLVGASYTPHGGAAYIYVQPADGWVNTDTPDATLTEAGSGCFGDTVAIGSGMIAVGDPCVQWGRGKRSTTGDAAVYLEPSGGWQNSNDGIVLRPFRSRQSNVAAVAENRVIVGADMTDVGNNQGQGAACIYTIPAQ
jgi:FG-GAP repeat